MRKITNAHATDIMLAIVLLLSITGCASTEGVKTQPISVHTIQDNKEVAGVGCTLKNDAGKWFVTTPASIKVSKSTGDLAIDCNKDGNVGGHETLVSKSNGAIWWNIINGGVIGFLVDRDTGVGFDYPDSVTVILRKIAGIVSPAPSAEVKHVSPIAEVQATPPPAGEKITDRTSAIR